MSDHRVSSEIIIFEGPDGGGKTTTAKALAEVMKAKYMHLGSFSGVWQNLPNMYVEAMMPAVQGLSCVVLDRSWLSEVPYGRAFRGGADRIGVESRRMLERLAMRCPVVVVKMFPPFETIVETFKRRRHVEMLDNEAQLRIVHDWYKDGWTTDLPTIDHDYTDEGAGGFSRLLEKIIETLRPQIAHRTSSPTAGPMLAPVLLVGDNFTNHQDGDSLYQWPFGALSGGGCSRWLTRQLATAGIPESDLCWVNADAESDVIRNMAGLDRRAIIALGHNAKIRMDDLQIRAECVQHPQYHRRFQSGAPYDLISRLKELTA